MAQLKAGGLLPMPICERPNKRRSVLPGAEIFFRRQQTTPPTNYSRLAKGPGLKDVQYPRTSANRYKIQKRRSSESY